MGGEADAADFESINYVWIYKHIMYTLTIIAKNDIFLSIRVGFI